MLSVSGVSRSHQGSQLSCLASNNNISAPSATSLVLDVQVLPVLVKISATEVDLVEGGGVSLECVVSGGNPRPSVSWLVNQERYSTLEYVSIVPDIETSQSACRTLSRPRERATPWSAPSSSRRPGSFTGRI